MKTIGAILSYNNPKMTDRLVENIRSMFKKDWTLIVMDNGSDEDKVSQYTTHRIKDNLRMVGGFNACIDFIEKEHSDYDNIWFFTNDCYFIPDGNCPLAIAEHYLEKYPEIGILHPSESHEIDVCFDVKHDNSIKGLKCVVEYDIVCPIFTKAAIKAVGGSFNKDLFQGWGLDYETSYLVRKAGMLVCINHQTVIGHNTSSTYDNGLDKLHPNRESYYRAAMTEMYKVLNEKYTMSWHSNFISTYNESHGKILN